VLVLRAVVSTPSVPPVDVILHEPSRQPSADVVVVAGAGGIAPVAVGAAVSVDDGVGDVTVDVALEVPDGVTSGVLVRDPLVPGDEVDRDPESPQIAPTMSPTTAASASETAMRPPTGMAPVESVRSGSTVAPYVVVAIDDVPARRRWQDRHVTPHPSLDGTRLDTEQYLEHLEADLEALLAASTDLAAEVPGCPDWSVADLLSHVVGVYRHKIAALDADASPELESGAWGDLPEGVDPRDALRDAYAELRVRLVARDADAPTWTWWPAEQTVGFWHRRMAQETAVHRWDAESALAGVDGAPEVAEDLAADGIDEVLGWLAWPWDELPQPTAAGQSVLVSAGGHSWTVTLHPTRVDVRGGTAGDASAFLAGEASGMLLHLWGRPGEHGIATMGDQVALALFRERLAMLSS
jgi:uncharacterized protein (TIGR03083 family)